MNMKRARGFTLVELLIVVVMLGFVLLIIAPTFNRFLTAQARAYDSKQEENNFRIAGALVNYAANASQFGKLPAPYTGGGYVSTIYNPADTSAAGAALTQALTQTGINPSEINDDGTTGARVRVYQRVTGLTQQVPLFFQSGPLATLTYDFGAVYMTTCNKNDASCNPSGTGVPGTSAVLSASNFATWKTSGTDAAGYQFVSTLPVQKSMLANTVTRLDKARGSLLSYLRAKQISAGAGDTTNWYPNQAGASAAGSMSGASPATNQGCRDGWYDLSSASVIVLPAVGLSREEYGTTSWGGRIEYCRDYDPTAAKSPNAAPHFAAIRILADVSSGGAPDGSVAGNNIVLTF